MRDAAGGSRWGAGAVAMAMALGGCGGDGEVQPADSGGPDGWADVADAADAEGETKVPEPDGAGPDADVPTAVAFCEGATGFIYDPVGGAALLAFPDDFMTEEAPTPTGLRVRVAEGETAWLASIPTPYVSTVGELSQLDGWGTSAGLIVGFTAPVSGLPSGDADSLASDAVQLLELGPDGPVRRPFEVQMTDEGRTAILWPMAPLRPATRHALVITSAFDPGDGGCVSPSPALRSVLDGSAASGDPRLARLVPRMQDVLSATGLAPGEVGAALLFTTQSLYEESAAVAADLATRAVTWKTGPTCAPAAAYLDCAGTFEALDFRDAGGVFAGGEPQRTYELDVRLWLPLTGAAPFPTLVFGHGLTGDRHQAKALADASAPLGFATVAIDAAHHGDHPDAEPGAGDIDSLIGFFALDLGAGNLRALRLRDNWRQSTWDKLQLVRLLELAPDVDGDGQADLDLGRFGYFGVSLGGIMGAEPRALTDRFGAAVLSVPGGRVGSIISDAQTFALIVQAMKPPEVGQGDVDRFFPVLQTLLDRGDAASWAPRVLASRLSGDDTSAPHLLVAMAMDDTTVPNVSTRALVRALGLPHLAPVLGPVGLVPVTSGPVSGNLAGGAVTAALFQFDRITAKDGSVAPATHDTLTRSPEAMLQALHFLEGWAAGEVPEILDPYEALGTPPL